MKANTYKISQLSFADLSELVQYCVRMIPYYNHKKDMTMVNMLTCVGNAAEEELKGRLRQLTIFLE